MQIPESNRAVISLEHDRAGRLFLERHGAARWAVEFHVFMDDLAVVDDFDHFCVLDFFAGGIETGRSKGDIEGLPLARRLAGIDARRMSFDGLAADRAPVNAA